MIYSDGVQAWSRLSVRAVDMRSNSVGAIVTFAGFACTARGFRFGHFAWTAWLPGRIVSIEQRLARGDLGSSEEPQVTIHDLAIT